VRVGAVLAAVCALATIALFAQYLQGFVYPDNSQRSRDPLFIGDFATRVASLAFGNAGEQWWAFSGWLIIAIVVATTALLVWVWFAKKDERWRVGALLVCLGATVALVLSIGFGRAGAGEGAAFAMRYITLPAPIVSTAVFAWILFGNRTARWAVPAVIATVLGIAAFTVNQRIGAEFAVERKQLGDDLMAEVHAGTPPALLIERWTGPDKIHNNHGRLYYILRQMALMKLKPFDDMPEEAREQYTWWMFNMPPSKIDSPAPVSRRMLNGVLETLVVPTGSEITFDVPLSLTHLSGTIGVPIGWLKFMVSRGVRVQVLVIQGSSSEREVFFERRLDPVNVPADRVAFTFDVEIKTLARKRQIVLSVTWPEDLPADEPREQDWIFFAETYFR